MSWRYWQKSYKRFEMLNMDKNLITPASKFSSRCLTNKIPSIKLSLSSWKVRERATLKLWSENKKKEISSISPRKEKIRIIWLPPFDRYYYFHSLFYCLNSKINKKKINNLENFQKKSLLKDHYHLTIFNLQKDLSFPLSLRKLLLYFS